MQKVFTDIYRNNRWACDETVSGGGSTLEFTKRLRKMLPQIVKQFEITSLLDAGCGDWHWMSKLDLGIPMIGCDIVPELVDKNQRRYGGDFRVLDITRDELPKVDAILCRATLFHLSNQNINQAITNFQKSGARFLITTTHPHVTENIDIQDGAWRRLNMEIEPFYLLSPLFSKPDGPGDDGYLAVWRLA